MKTGPNFILESLSMHMCSWLDQIIWWFKSLNKLIVIKFQQSGHVTSLNILLLPKVNCTVYDCSNLKVSAVNTN